MIQTKSELINMIPLIYQNFHMPIYLLSQDMNILDYTHEFFTLENHYFADIIEDPSCIESYPIYTHFLHNEFYFFFHYPLADIKYICIGPYFSLKVTPQDHPSDFPFQPVSIGNKINMQMWCSFILMKITAKYPESWIPFLKILHIFIQHLHCQFSFYCPYSHVFTISNLENDLME